MANKGAKHLILLSRSGPRFSKVIEVIAELEEQGVRVSTPYCDMCLKNVTIVRPCKECKKSMPPIKGCINAATDLQVHQITCPN